VRPVVGPATLPPGRLEEQVEELVHRAEPAREPAASVLRPPAGVEYDSGAKDATGLGGVDRLASGRPLLSPSLIGATAGDTVLRLRGTDRLDLRRRHHTRTLAVVAGASRSRCTPRMA
jgi:hypothetical protein